jgi:hypothetical protein
MTAKLIRTEKLANGLKLELLDLSRPLAGDRWAVAVVARAAVPVTAQSAGAAADSWTAVRDLLGLEVVYEKKMGRSFVDGAEKDAVVAAIVASFCQQVLPYIARPLFVPRFISQRYREALAKRGWYPAENISGGTPPPTPGSAH